MIMEFLAYEFKAALAFALFYLFFRLLLSKETLHAFNRFMILASCFIALVIPLCEMEVEHPIVAISLDMLPVIKSFNDQIGTDVKANTATSLFSFENIALAVFFIGFLTILVGTIVSLVQILLIIKREKIICRGNGYKLVVCNEKIVPMSWMKWIIISEEDYNSDNECIILHEEAHIQLRHSWDILFMELFTAVQWFNPAAWMMRSDLRAIHEYEADEYVINSGIDVKQYQLLLVKKAVGVSGNSISNSFNHSALKKRITMMLSNKSSLKSMLKALYMLPLVGICLTANATGIQSSNSVNTQQETTLSYSDVEVKPAFQGGDINKFVLWMLNELKYPEEAIENNEEGRIAVTMVIDTDGSVTDIEVATGVSKSLETEVLRVLSCSPKWTPGYVDGKAVRVQYLVPVIYKIPQRNEFK